MSVFNLLIFLLINLVLNHLEFDVNLTK